MRNIVIEWGGKVRLKSAAAPAKVVTTGVTFSGSPKVFMSVRFAPASTVALACGRPPGPARRRPPTGLPDNGLSGPSRTARTGQCIAGPIVRCPRPATSYGTARDAPARRVSPPKRCPPGRWQTRLGPARPECTGPVPPADTTRHVHIQRALALHQHRQPRFGIRVFGMQRGRVFLPLI